MNLPPAVRSIFAPKSLVACLCFGATLSVAGVAAAEDAPKVAVVDVAKVFLDYYKTKEFNAKIAEAQRAYGDEYDNRLQVHHRLVEELARIDKDLGNPALAAPARADRQKQRESNVEQTRRVELDIKDFRANRERAIQEMTVRVRTQVVEDIMVVLNARIQTQHYDLILNKSGLGAGERAMVLYANENLNITDDVLAALNRNRPAPGRPTPLP